jgi:hypothetical protein
MPRSMSESCPLSGVKRTSQYERPTSSDALVTAVDDCGDKVGTRSLFGAGVTLFDRRPPHNDFGSDRRQRPGDHIRDYPTAVGDLLLYSTLSDRFGFVASHGPQFNSPPLFLRYSDHRLASDAFLMRSAANAPFARLMKLSRTSRRHEPFPWKSLFQFGYPFPRFRQR